LLLIQRDYLAGFGLMMWRKVRLALNDVKRWTLLDSITCD